MAKTETTTPLFEAQAEIVVAAPAATVYALVSDLPRSREWSGECIGGEWISGIPGAVGAVFRGHNARGADVVGWAPVVRGVWTTEAEIRSAVPGVEFSWAMRDSRGHAQSSVWAFRMSPEDDGCRLTHHFRMDTPTEGIRKITQDMDDAGRRRFVTDWGAKIGADLHETLRRIRAIVEHER
jgi:Polyketide cyclase / dehydrase and lipid transport